MEIELKDLIDNPKSLERVTIIKTDYSLFKKSEVFLRKNLGSDARGFFIEKSAYLVFEDRPDILVIINEKQFNKEDFYLDNINIKISGKSSRRIKGFWGLLKDDLIGYKIGIIVLLTLYVIIFCLSNSAEGLQNLNSAFVDIISIFIGVLFVFATIFYEETEIDQAIESGGVQELFITDKYIFSLALLSLIFVIISNGILDYKILNGGIIISTKEYLKHNFYGIYWIIRYGISELLTGISIIFNYICFRSIIDYYLGKIKVKSISKKIKNLKNDIINSQE